MVSSFPSSIACWSSDDKVRHEFDDLTTMWPTQARDRLFLYCSLNEDRGKIRQPNKVTARDEIYMFFRVFSFSVSSFYSFSHTFILIYLFSLALYKCFFKPSLSLCIYIIHNIFYVSFLFLSFAVFSLTFLFLIIIYLCNFFVFLHFSFVLLIKRLNS